jgi:hypothetical protein
LSTGTDEADMQSTMSRIRWTALLGALALTAVAGCGSDRTPVDVARGPAVAVPDAGSHALLTLGGRIGNRNAGRQLRLDARSLATLGVRTVELYEPFEKRRMRFQAVPLRNLLALAGVSGDAQALHAVALNDYVVDLPLDVAESGGTYLALRNGDGSAIDVEDGGPIRIVFADRAKGAGSTNYWIWSLATVTAR